MMLKYTLCSLYLERVRVDIGKCNLKFKARVPFLAKLSETETETAKCELCKVVLNYILPRSL